MLTLGVLGEQFEEFFELEAIGNHDLLDQVQLGVPGTLVLINGLKGALGLDLHVLFDEGVLECLLGCFGLLVAGIFFGRLASSQET